MPKPKQELLMKYLKEGNIQSFTNLLRIKTKSGKQVINPNHEYGDPYYNSCLIEAIKRNCTEFVEVLLNNGADPNQISIIRDSNTPLHFALSKETKIQKELNFDVIKLLLERQDINVNAVNRYNDTALHLATRHLPESEDICLLLLSVRNINLKVISNKTDKSAIQEALEMECSRKILRKLINLSILNEDRILILEKHPDLIYDEAEEITNNITSQELFQYLKNRKIDDFMNNFKRELVNEVKEIKMTLLQLACVEGLYDEAEFIILNGADLNLTTNAEIIPPIHLTCLNGHINILKLLIENGADIKVIKSKTLFHQVLQGLCSRNGDEQQYQLCFDFLIDKRKTLNIPLTYGDENGLTPLHYAVTFKNDYYAKQLLRHGAYIGYINDFGISPLSYIHPITLKNVLDECIKGENTKDNRYNLEFKFDILKPELQNDFNQNEKFTGNSQWKNEKMYNINLNNDENESIIHENYKSEALQMTNTETEIIQLNIEENQSSQFEEHKHEDKILPEMFPLYFISKSKKLEHLLTHPTLLVFLLLKWNRVRLLFYLNVLFYIIYLSFLTADILCNSNNCDECVIKDPTCSECYIGSSKILRGFLYLFYILFFLKHIIQFFLIPNKVEFFYDVENLLEIGIIITSGLILNGNCSKFLLAIALLFVWSKLILQFGCIYTLDIYNEMIKTVTINYFKFIVWYSPLIIAFLFSFYKLYHGNGSSNHIKGNFSTQNIYGNISVEKTDENSYHDYSTSLLKIIVMMVGEFEASNMSFDNGGYVIFLIFVFMISIVLMNLLNALAISDTQAIKKNAKLVSYKTKVQSIYNFEYAIFKCTNYIHCNGLLKKICLFPDVIRKTSLCINITHGPRFIDHNAKDMEFRPDTCCTIGSLRVGFDLVLDVLLAAKEIVDSRETVNDKGDFENSVVKLQADVKEIKKHILKLEELIQQLIKR